MSINSNAYKKVEAANHWFVGILLGVAVFKANAGSNIIVNDWMDLFNLVVDIGVAVFFVSFGRKLSKIVSERFQ